MFKLAGYFCLPVLLAAALVACPKLHAEDRPQPAAPAASIAPTAPQPAIEPDQRAVIDIGDAVAMAGRYETAIKIYAKAPQITAEIWNKMGMSYQMMFNAGEAIRCYHKSLKLNPRDPGVLNNLATLYVSQGDFAKADRFFREALGIDPHDAAILKNLGTSLIAQRKFAEGFRAYEQAMALDPGVFQVNGNPTFSTPARAHERGAMNYFMARAYVLTGQISRALDSLRLSLNEGYVDSRKVASDPAFAMLSADPAFQRLLAEESVR
jgi:Flp pilus assembly protein TadD